MRFFKEKHKCPTCDGSGSVTHFGYAALAILDVIVFVMIAFSSISLVSLISGQPIKINMQWNQKQNETDKGEQQ